jgi:hypothetical protein
MYCNSYLNYRVANCTIQSSTVKQKDVQIFMPYSRPLIHTAMQSLVYVMYIHMYVQIHENDPIYILALQIHARGIVHTVMNCPFSILAVQRLLLLH